MPCSICHHIKADGIRCGSPALSRKLYCYFHQRLASRRRLSPRPAAPDALALDTIEGRIDIQLNLSQVINAVAIGRLDTRRAMVLLKGLHLAAVNLTALESTNGFDENPSI